MKRSALLFYALSIIFFVQSSHAQIEDELTRDIVIDIYISLTACCEEINAKLDNLDVTCTNVSFMPVFTVLDDIKNTLTECCLDLHDQIADVKDTLTECCVELKADFAGVFTVLASQKITFTNCCALLEEDIADLKNTLTECCLDLHDQIADVKDTLTECCAELQADFAGVFTVLAAQRTTLTGCCELLENEIADVKDTLTACCLTLEEDIANVLDTLTTCCDDIENDIADLKISLTDCCQEILSELADIKACCTSIDFTPIFTTLADIKNILTVCCSELDAFLCAPTLITQADVGATGFTITTPGTYFLSENITFAPAGAANAITINSNNVLLDMRCFSISQTNATASVNGVSVSATRSHVTMLNGSISAFTGAGIFVDQNTSIVECNAVEVMNSARGIAYVGTTGNLITKGKISDCDLISNTTGIAWYFSYGGIIENCDVVGSTRAGYDFRSSVSTISIDCAARNTNANGAGASAYGVFVNSGSYNSFNRWAIHDTSANATTANNSANGFFIGSSESNLKLENSQISNCSTTNNAQPFGVQMQYVFTTISPTGQPSFASGTVVQSVAWSSDGRFVAIGGDSNSVTVLEYTGTRLIPVATFAHGSIVNSVAWSPDGRYIAMGGGLGTGSFQVRVLDFSGTSLTSVANFAHGADILGVTWSPEGRYIAIAGAVGTGTFTVRAMEFTGAALVTSANFNHGGTTNSVSWSPGGRYIAIGGANGTGTFNVRVLDFTGTALNTAASFIHGATVNAVAYSPNGRYVGMSGLAGTGGFQVRVLDFNGSTLTSVANFNGGNTTRAIAWSSDGQYLAAGDDGGVLRGLLFNGTSLTTAATYNRGAPFFAVAWSGSGKNIAIGGTTLVVEMEMLSAMQFPQNCIIINNLISRIVGPALGVNVQGVSSGRGLSASSGSNLILKNTAFSNDINYIFVTDVYTQYLVNVRSTTPSVVENISYPPL